jgi:hypothetical protein
VCGQSGTFRNIGVTLQPPQTEGPGWPFHACNTVVPRWARRWRSAGQRDVLRVTPSRWHDQLRFPASTGRRRAAHPLSETRDHDVARKLLAADRACPSRPRSDRAGRACRQFTGQHQRTSWRAKRSVASGAARAREGLAPRFAFRPRAAARSAVISGSGERAVTVLVTNSRGQTFRSRFRAAHRRRRLA